MKFLNASPFYFAILYPAYLLITVGKLRFTVLLCTTLSIISNLVVFPVYGIDTRFDKLYRRLLNLYVFKRPMKCVPYQNNCFGFNSQYYYHLVTFVYARHPLWAYQFLLQQYYHSTILLYKLKFWILSLSSILCTIFILMLFYTCNFIFISFIHIYSTFESCQSLM